MKKIDFQEQISNLKIGTVCKVCKGRGKKGGCESCGKVLAEINTKVRTVRELSKIDKALIPDEYLRNTWSLDVLQSERGDSIYSTKYKDVSMEMSRVHDRLTKGELPNHSTLLIAESGFSKTVWAYSCMAEGMKHGYKVAPLLDTSEANILMTLCTERPGYLYRNQFKYEDFIDADLCIVKVIQNDYVTEAYVNIITILDKRSRAGKPTIIISSYPREYLVRNDTLRKFRKYLELGNINPNNKYPKLVEQVSNIEVTYKD